MGLRLLASFPIAALMVAVLLVSASSYVSAVEASFTLNSRTNVAIRIDRYETKCRELDRAIQQISRRATACDRDLQCLGSPILCPISLNEKEEREYRKLRGEFGRQCDGLYALTDESDAGFSIDFATCGGALDGPATSIRNRSSQARVFVF